MKVDKAVCTHEPILEDLNSAKRYEAVFTTLVENKILAIKRDCEERQRLKKIRRHRSLGGILSTKRIFCVKRNSAKDRSLVTENINMCHQTDSNNELTTSGGNGAQGGITGNIIVVGGGDPSSHTLGQISIKSIYNKDKVENVVFRKNVDNDDDDDATSCTTDDDHDDDDDDNEYVDNVEVYENKAKQNAHNEWNRNEFSSTIENLHVKGKLNECTLLNKQGLINYERHNDTYEVECTNTAAIVHRYETESICSDKSKRITFKSDLIDKEKSHHPNSLTKSKISHRKSINDDSINSSHNSSFLELHGDSVKKSQRNSSETLSYPSSSRKNSFHSYVNNGQDPATILLDHEKYRLRLLEAKSISAQCSPILPRPIVYQPTRYSIATQVSYSEEDNKISLEKNPPIKLCSRQNTSEDSAANITISSAVDEDEAPKFLSINNKKLSHYGSFLASSTTRLDKDKFVVSSNVTAAAAPALDNSSSAHGFINSFNQLTSNSLNKKQPVITTITTPKTNCDTIKLHRLVHTSSISSSANSDPAATISHCSKNSQSNQNQENSQKIGGKKNIISRRKLTKEASFSEEDLKRNKKKYRRGHRCSDPVLVYPSSNGLQHCILSMPPNQPMQLQYDEDVIYDVALQVDSDHNDDLESMVPGRRKHKHRHHHHHHHHHHHNDRKKKSHKKKILVHDLDNQSVKVKVIDPDDLPQRARWTIIATACLLLIMCLLLVGVTLRMAPLIDDMGKFVYKNLYYTINYNYIYL